MDIHSTVSSLPGEAPGRRRAGVRAGLAAIAVVLACLVLPVHSASAADATFNQRLLDNINRERVANSLPRLVLDTTLSATAEDAPYNGCGFTVLGRAKDMGQRNYFDHNILGCAGQTVFNLLAGVLSNPPAENLAWMNGTTDPTVAADNLHSQLMSSAGHRANILNSNFTRVGLGSWHTAPGQAWSGGGSSLLNVFIGVEIFAAGTPDTGTTGPAGRFTPLTPARILDTRDGTGGISGPIPAGGTVDVQVTGRGGIPTTDVAAVAMNVAVTQPTAGGYLTVFPAGAARPTASNLNFVANQTVSNLVVVKVGANGKVSIFNPAGTTHVVADVAGWYSATGAGDAGRFQPLAPARILDTRTGTGGATRLGPGASLDLQVAGSGGVPLSGVAAAVLNMTVTGTTAGGYLTAYPTGEARPWASSLNFAAGDTMAGRAMIKLGTAGKVTIYNGGQNTDVIVDVGGWYTDGSVAGTLGALTPVTPARILDTRDGTGGTAGAVAASGTVDIQVTGRGGVPASGARAVVLNATVTSPADAGYLTIFPSGTARPLASDLNFAAGDTRPNLVVVQLGAGGKVSLFSSATTHVIFDVAGWMS